MKVFLDDERIPPKGWVLVRWPQEAIEMLKNNNVEIISLDHDLGDDTIGTGYDVILWIEEQVALKKLKAPIIKVHSANVSVLKKMIAGIQNIYKMEKANAKTSENNQK